MRSREVNGKPYWIDEKAKYAVWYNGENGAAAGWKFGNASNIGSRHDGVLMWSNDDQKSPSAVSSWISSTINNFECTIAENETSQVWHGETNIASFYFLGENFGRPRLRYSNRNGDRKAMFDYRFEDNAMYHSPNWYGGRENYGGASITFKAPVQFDDLLIYTRTSCCRINRYQGVCLYADDLKIACTPDDLDDPGPTINFKSHLIVSGPVVARKYKLSWDYWYRNPDELLKYAQVSDAEVSDLVKRYAQIEELFLYYTPLFDPGTLRFSNLIRSIVTGIPVEPFSKTSVPAGYYFVKQKRNFGY